MAQNPWKTTFEKKKKKKKHGNNMGKKRVHRGELAIFTRRVSLEEEKTHTESPGWSSTSLTFSAYRGGKKTVTQVSFAVFLSSKFDVELTILHETSWLKQNLLQTKKRIGCWLCVPKRSQKITHLCICIFYFIEKKARRSPALGSAPHAYHSRSLFLSASWHSSPALESLRCEVAGQEPRALEKPRGETLPREFMEEPMGHENNGCLEALVSWSLFCREHLQRMVHF